MVSCPEILETFRVSSLGSKLYQFDNRFFINVWVKECPYLALVDSGFNGNVILNLNVKENFMNPVFHLMRRTVKLLLLMAGRLILREPLLFL